MNRAAFNGTIEIVNTLIGSLSTGQANFYAEEPDSLVATIQSIYDKLDKISNETSDDPQ